LKVEDNDESFIDRKISQSNQFRDSSTNIY